MIICFQQLKRIERLNLLGTCFALYKVIINLRGEVESYRPLKRSLGKEIEVNAKAHKVPKG